VLAGGAIIEKSKARRLTVAFPAELVPELRWHLDRFAAPGERRLVFHRPERARRCAGRTSVRSGTLRATNLASPDCISMIFGTSAGLWRLRPERASRS
jgi:hypothetical protein